MRASRSRALISLFILLAAFGAAMALVGPAQTLDKKPWYSVETAVKLIEDLGPAGRSRYLRNELLDLGFLFTYSLFAWLAIGSIWERRLSARALRRAQYLSLLPGLFDLAETSLVISALTHYPRDLAAMAGWLCLATPAKWLAASLLVASALAGAASDA